MPLADLVVPGVELARDGLEINRQQAYLLEILGPILAREPAGAAVYAPHGRMLGLGERICFPELAETIERLGAAGPEPFYRGDIGAAIAAKVEGEGGTVGAADLVAYETAVREPVRAGFAGCEILTNPPPSSGGILIAYALELLGRLGATDGESVVMAMEQAQDARTREFLSGLYEPGFARRFLGDRLGSTTHITALDGEGGCASVTCSNGSGLGRVRGRDRHPAQQHARRGGPESVRVPLDDRRAADALDDVADDRPSRRRARARARQRRVEPDPLGDHPDDHPLPRRGPQPRRGRRTPPGSTSRPGPSMPSRGPIPIR